MGVIEIEGARFKARAVAKVFRMLLVLCAERRSASRFSFLRLLRIVICGGERDWRTDGGESGCASRFSLSRSLKMVMCGGERDWRTEYDGECVMIIEGSDHALVGLLRMLCGPGDNGGSEGGRYIVEKGLGVTFSLMVRGPVCARVLAGLVRTVMDWSLEITRCSSGLLEPFVPVVLERLISRARSVAVGRG
jgi:hypothetical protein